MKKFLKYCVYALILPMSVMLASCGDDENDDQAQLLIGNWISTECEEWEKVDGEMGWHDISHDDDLRISFHADGTAESWERDVEHSGVWEYEGKVRYTYADGVIKIYDDEGYISEMTVKQLTNDILEVEGYIKEMVGATVYEEYTHVTYRRTTDNFSYTD